MRKPAYVHYKDPAFLSEFLADMKRPCLIPGAKSGHLMLHYDTETFDFRPIIAKFLKEKNIISGSECFDDFHNNLERLHDFVAVEDQILDNTQHNAVAVALYDLKGEFNTLYQRFIGELIAPALGMGDVFWQLQPTFRVFFPYTKGYPGKTTYHSDLMLGHNPREINVFLPFTSCDASRSLLMAPLEESLEIYRSFDYDFAAFATEVQENGVLQKKCAKICEPLKMEVGKALIFDSRCLHAGPPNETRLTRMTVDFRLLPKGDIKKQQNIYQGTGRTKALFAPGGAFSQNTLPFPGHVAAE